MPRRSFSDIGATVILYLLALLGFVIAIFGFAADAHSRVNCVAFQRSSPSVYIPDGDHPSEGSKSRDRSQRQAGSNVTANGQSLGVLCSRPADGAGSITVRVRQ